MIRLLPALLVLLVACGFDLDPEEPQAIETGTGAAPAIPVAPAETAPAEVETTPDEEGTLESEPSARCLESWQQFGAIDDLQDSLKDVVPTLFACANVKEWIQAGEATPGHSLIVIRLTAENICRGQKGTQGAPVCESLKG